MDFNQWWEDHGQYNVNRAHPYDAVGRQLSTDRVKQLMKLAFEVGQEPKE